MTHRIIAFQGEHGAFSEEAIHRHFGTDAHTLPCESFAKLFQAIQRGDATTGMVPVENALAGTVAQAYELLMEYDFRVQSECLLPVHHYLLANEGVTQDDVRQVRSHPQALAQCADYLRRRGWEPVAAYDTAGAACQLASAPDPHTAVLASALAGQRYGLVTLEQSVEDNPINSTRFFMIGADDAERKDPSKTSLVFAVRHRPGSLYDCLGAFARRSINLTKIESRPLRGRPWQYWFYLDFEGHWQEPHVKDALADLVHTASMVKMLGSYPAASGGPNTV
ncbi:MAG: prephenate dehydratase [Anaerolineae bacterium]|nr:prephenate dehydratase [Anaerolineae bacterium]